jgi:hypothetical protein
MDGLKFQPADPVVARPGPPLQVLAPLGAVGSSDNISINWCHTGARDIYGGWQSSFLRPPIWSTTTMTKSTLLSVSTLALCSSALSAAPDGLFHDMHFESKSHAEASDLVANLQEGEMDEGNVGNNWATASQSSFVSATTDTMASGTAHGAVDATGWETGFTAWGYARAMSQADLDQEATSDSQADATVWINIENHSVLTGSFCRMGTTLRGSIHVAMLFSRVDTTGDSELLKWDGCGPDVCNSNCAEFELELAPGLYRFQGTALAETDNDAGNWQESWAEFNVEFDVQPVVIAQPDLNRDGIIDGQDLARLLSGWNGTEAALDLDGNGKIGGGDLSMLLAAWK